MSIRTWLGRCQPQARPTAHGVDLIVMRGRIKLECGGVWGVDLDSDPSAPNPGTLSGKTMKTMRTNVVAAALWLAQSARAIPQAVSSSATAPGGVSTGVPSITLSTATPAPTVPLTSTLPSQVALPPKQDWCPSEIFCASEVCSKRHRQMHMSH